MKVLVTGSGGFLGSEVVERLMMNGHQVLATGRGLTHRVCELVPLKFVDCDNRPELLAAFTEFEPEAVVHCAGLASTPVCIQNPERCWLDNFVAAHNVLEASRITHVRRVVLASSNVVYGSRSPYRAAKLAMELDAEAYTATYGLSAICLRYGNLYGPGMSKGFIAAAYNFWKKKRPLPFSGCLKNTRDFTHVRDAAEATVQALHSGFNGWTDVCSNKEVKLGRIIACLPGLEIERTGPQPGDVPHLHQGHSFLLDKWESVEDWLCALSS